MAYQQDHEWVEAQKIVISTNLVVAAKKHLQFLEVVDKNGNLYEGPVLEKAIYRYKYCWLPLLAEHVDRSSELPESRLVVPLDCEWIWHCHRLNPVRYAVDCIQLFRRILDPGCVVVSSIEGACKKHTEEIWKNKYPEESYELDLDDLSVKNDTQSTTTNLRSTNYDLVSAVKRQSSFYHKVSSAIFMDDLYLEAAVQRYKGFLRLVTKNMEKKLNNPCVPTYDIDLIWHTHQLHPRSYCKDAIALAGQLLHHDDTDTDQTQGGKLDVGVKTTTQQWTEMFGSSYWRVGSRPVSDTAVNIEGDHSTAVTARCWCIYEDTGKEKSTARCMIIPVDNMVAGEKLAARCMIIPADNVEAGEKSTARCMCIPTDNMVAGEKLTARCMIIPADNMEAGEKLTARCMMIPAENVEAGEKSTARCMCIPIDNMVVGEKLTTRCMIIPANNVEAGEKSTARCMCIPADNMVAGEKLIARCMIIPANKMEAEEKSTARCMIIPAHNMVVGDKSTARCMCIPAEYMVAGKKSTARCMCIPADDMSSARTARCWCIAEQMDGQKLILESIASGAIQV